MQYLNVAEPFCVGFGLHAVGQTYPANLHRRLGKFCIWVWQSIDAGTSWTQVGDGFPAGSIDTIKDIDGDGGTFGTVYLVTGGNGAFIGTQNSRVGGLRLGLHG